ncbi:hypothetical protein N7468_000426 [Penicillium chermesinum]|uniref:Uncharacterized protein n=1 Tax=Penicillium chermesinum TaxID=63820 RepID=A0A9W9TZB1_9EURO|nr:uncharacterized protein N7468_000426 [Penicillium chermesinum]KAJ5248975.1 hypothetical protein N7468_000426 [Penicillium chermesinum]KAJ6151080.1 hypothetical protein N7470_007674 [Penicillium chermesinum]
MANKVQLHSNQENFQAKEDVEHLQYQKLVVDNDGYEKELYLLEPLFQDAQSYTLEQKVEVSG